MKALMKKTDKGQRRIIKFYRMKAGMGEEVWRQMIYRGEIIDRFLISNKGNIKNKYSGKLIKQSISKKGYSNVTISLGRTNNKLNVKVHRAVAEAFIENPDNLPLINHKDGNKLNNCVSNLEWSTDKDNITHAISTGLINPYVNSRVKRIMSLEDGKEYFSVGEAGREYASKTISSDAARKNISRALVCGGSAYGMTWVYVRDKNEC